MDEVVAAWTPRANDSQLTIMNFWTARRACERERERESVCVCVWVYERKRV
jgi:hypothetical protein